MTNWGILSCLVKQTCLSWTDTWSSPYRGIQPCAAVTLQHTHSSLANIKPPHPPILVRHPSSLTSAPCMERQHYSSQIIRKERNTSLFFFSSLAISLRCSAVKFETHAWILSSFFKPSFFFFSSYEASLQPVRPPSTPPLSFPPWSSPVPPAHLLPLPPGTFVWLVWLDWEEMGWVVIRMGGNGIHSHLVQT